MEKGTRYCKRWVKKQGQLCAYVPTCIVTHTAAMLLNTKTTTALPEVVILAATSMIMTLGIRVQRA